MKHHRIPVKKLFKTEIDKDFMTLISEDRKEKYGEVNGWYLFAKQSDESFVTVGEDVKVYINYLLDKQLSDIIKLIEGIEQIYIDEWQSTVVPANAIVSRHKQSVVQKILTEIKKGGK